MLIIAIFGTEVAMIAVRTFLSCIFLFVLSVPAFALDDQNKDCGLNHVITVAHDNDLVSVTASATEGTVSAVPNQAIAYRRAASCSLLATTGWRIAYPSPKILLTSSGRYIQTSDERYIVSKEIVSGAVIPSRQPPAAAATRPTEQDLVNWTDPIRVDANGQPINWSIRTSDGMEDWTKHYYLENSNSKDFSNGICIISKDVSSATPPTDFSSVSKAGLYIYKTFTLNNPSTRLVGWVTFVADGLYASENGYGFAVALKNIKTFPDNNGNVVSDTNMMPVNNIPVGFPSIETNLAYKYYDSQHLMTSFDLGLEIKRSYSKSTCIYGFIARTTVGLDKLVDTAALFSRFGGLPIGAYYTKDSELDNFAKAGFNFVGREIRTVDDADPVLSAAQSNYNKNGMLLEAILTNSIYDYPSKACSDPSCILKKLSDSSAKNLIVGIDVADEPVDGFNGAKASVTDFIRKFRLAAETFKKNTNIPIWSNTKDAGFSANVADDLDQASSESYYHPVIVAAGRTQMTAALDGLIPSFAVIASFKGDCRRPDLRGCTDAEKTATAPDGTLANFNKTSWMLVNAYASLAQGGQGINFFGCNDYGTQDLSTPNIIAKGCTLDLRNGELEVARRLRFFSDAIVFGRPFYDPVNAGFQGTSAPLPGTPSDVKRICYTYDSNYDGVPEIWCLIANTSGNYTKYNMPGPSAYNDPAFLKASEMFILFGANGSVQVPVPQGQTRIDFDLNGYDTVAVRIIPQDDKDYIK